MSIVLTRLSNALGTLWPKRNYVTLPERIREAIAHNDDDSEILVKIIQFVVFAVWGIAYLAAPQPNPETVSRVPLIISLYLIFTVVLLFIALMRRTPEWLIYLSIVVDIALLTFLIWSFHLQYGQPASFSLKVVEVMNYFVLIGLRALRFEARYVLAAGLTAVLGWSAIVFYVVNIDPENPMITSDYVTYITSNSVLIGAEVSKMLSIVLFTAILAIAVRRGHHFVTSSVAESSAAEDLSRFMESSVAEQIRGSEQQIQAGEGVRKEVAILNVDIRGFTKLVANMDPVQAMKLLADYQHQIVPIAHDHGGTVDKFMGDGIMITFGASSGHDAPCANALRCIDALLAQQDTWSGPSSQLTINLAVTAGPVIFGAVGDGDRLEFTVIGASVNKSAKLEKHNKVLGTRALSGEYCFRKAVEQGYQNTAHRELVSTSLEGDETKSNVVVLG